MSLIIVEQSAKSSVTSTVFGRPFVKRFTLCYQTVVCLSYLSVCDVDVLWPNGWMDQNETWHGTRARSWPHCVRWGPAPLPQRGTALPQFSVHVCCGQTAGRIKMPLGREVGLGPGDIVIDGDPAPHPEKGHSTPPFFSPCLLWPNGWMDQDATGYEGRPRPRPHCLRWGPSSPPKTGHSHPIFWPVSIVANRLPISGTAELGSNRFEY